MRSCLPTLALTGALVFASQNADAAAGMVSGSDLAPSWQDRLVTPVVSGNLLSQEEIETNVKSLDGWSVRSDGKAITKSFEFADFNEAFGFMSRVALAAEKLDHHPTWSNVYKKVDILLNSFNKNGITDLDIELARRIDAIAKAQ